MAHLFVEVIQLFVSQRTVKQTIDRYIVRLSGENKQSMVWNAISKEHASDKQTLTTKELLLSLTNWVSDIEKCIVAIGSEKEWRNRYGGNDGEGGSGDRDWTLSWRKSSKMSDEVT